MGLLDTPRRWTASQMSLRSRVLVALIIIAAAAAGLTALSIDSTADLDLPDLLDGRNVSLPRLHGQVVVVVFVRTPSTACDRLLESLRSTSPTAAIVAVVESNDEETAMSYARRLGRPFLIVHDAGHRAIARFQPHGVPAVYIFDQNGALYHRYPTPPIDISVVETDIAQLQNR